MRESAGQANIVMITIVIIGVIAAAGGIFIPRLTENIKAQSCCSEQGGSFNKDTGKCDGGTMDGKTVPQMKAEDICH